MPCIRCRDGDEFSPRAGPIDSHPLGIWTEMTPAREAVAAVATGYMAFTHHELAFIESAHVRAHLRNLANELVPIHHRHLYCLSRPVVPIVNVNVSAADRSFLRADQHILGTNFWHRDFLQPQPGFRFGFDDGRHRPHAGTV